MLIDKAVVAAPPQTSPLEVSGLVHAEALRQGMGRATQVYVLADGAPWIWNVYADRFGPAQPLLDFHHAAEHLWALAHHLFDKQQAREWVEPLLHQLRHGKEKRVLQCLEELLEQHPDSKVVETEQAYFQTHQDHLQYQKQHREGAPIGTGAVESLANQLQGRFKRTGQYWCRRGIAALLSLEVAIRNGYFEALWNLHAFPT